MKSKYEDKTYWFARGYYDGRKFGEEKSLELVEKWVALARVGEKIRIAYKQGFDSGVEDYTVYGDEKFPRSIVPKVEEV